MVSQLDRDTLPFGADTARLLHMTVHSLYTEKEMFLRELRLEAPDALGRRRRQPGTFRFEAAT
jgi:HSP90 family molecular chaperone